MGGTATDGGGGGNGGGGGAPVESCPPAGNATSGGSWGEPWEAQVTLGFDFPGDLLDLGYIYDLGDAGGTQGGEGDQENQEPENWEYDANAESYYRQATLAETEKNGWKPGSLLVLPPQQLLTDLATGQPSTTFQLPLADPLGAPQTSLPFEAIKLVKNSEGQRNFITIGERAVNRVLTMRGYLSDGLSPGNIAGTIVAGVAGSGGGIELGGAMFDRKFTLSGPYKPSSGIYVEIPIPEQRPGLFVLTTTHGRPFEAPRLPPGAGRLVRGPSDGPGSLTSQASGIAAPVSQLQCTDGLNNDPPDTVADGCDFSCIPHADFGGTTTPHTLAYEQSKNVALMGDREFIALNPDNAEVILEAIASGGTTLINQLEAPPGYGQARTPPVRVVMMGFFDASAACHANADFCNVTPNYPFRGVNGDSSEALLRVWSAVDELAAFYGDTVGPSAVHPVQIAGVISGSFEAQVQGKAYEGSLPQRVGSFALSGVNVSTIAFAHEVGHTLGLAHEDTKISDNVWECGADCNPSSFMVHNGGSGYPFVTWNNPSLVPGMTQGEAWGEKGPQKNWPRSPGFSYVGCANDDDCSTPSHPHVEWSCQGGLLCVKEN